MQHLEHFIEKAPKAELHVHIEGTLEPEMVIKLAQRNKITLPFSTAEDIRAQFSFTDLASFLKPSYENMRVLVKEEDFYDLTCAYLTKAHQNSICHAEIFFDPQAHLRRGVPFEVVVNGITQAFSYGKELGISCYLILCFLRDLPAHDAHKVLKLALPFKDKIIAVGLDSAERNNPPSKFTKVFKEALSHGFLTVCHAGEEGPPDYIWQALKLLHASRIDHGTACIQDLHLVEYLAHNQIPLTMCPLSNVRLKVVQSLTDYPAKYLLDQDVCVTINSDDPAYFGGYINQNLLALYQALHLTKSDLYTLLQNSFKASFLPKEEKASLIKQLQEYEASTS